MNDGGIDMLRRIFAMQTELNDYVFRKNGLSDGAGGALSMAAIEAAANSDALMVNDLPNQWLGHYAKAIEEELKELNADLLWKWWSKDRIDIQNIRVELIDILHFLVSAMICSGLTADDVCEIYRQKHAVNVRRQDSGYSKATKDETDNREIG